MERALCLSILATCVFLTGCSNLPPISDVRPSENPRNDSRSIKALSRQIDCEIARAVDDIRPAVPKDGDVWVVSYTITNKSTDDAELGISPLDWVIPANITKLTLKAEAKASQTRDVTGKAKFTLILDDMATQSAAKTPNCPESKTRSSNYVPSDFGVSVWLREIAEAIQDRENHKVGDLGYTVLVKTSAKGSLGSTGVDTNITAGGSMSATRTLQQTVDFAFSIQSIQPPVSVKKVTAAGRKASRDAAINRAEQENSNTLQKLQLERLTITQ